MLVQSDDCGWVVFGAGFFDTEALAWEQLRIFAERYPDRKFTVHGQ